MLSQQEIIEVSESEFILKVVEGLKQVIEKSREGDLNANVVFNNLSNDLEAHGLTVSDIIHTEFYKGLVLSNELLASEYFVNKHFNGIDYSKVKRYMFELHSLILSKLS